MLNQIACRMGQWIAQFAAADESTDNDKLAPRPPVLKSIVMFSTLAGPIFLAGITASAAGPLPVISGRPQQPAAKQTNANSPRPTGKPSGKSLRAGMLPRIQELLNATKPRFTAPRIKSSAPTSFSKHRPTPRQTLRPPLPVVTPQNDRAPMFSGERDKRTRHPLIAITPDRSKQPLRLMPRDSSVIILPSVPEEKLAEQPTPEFKGKQEIKLIPTQPLVAEQQPSRTAPPFPDGLGKVPESKVRTAAAVRSDDDAPAVVVPVGGEQPAVEPRKLTKAAETEATTDSADKVDQLVQTLKSADVDARRAAAAELGWHGPRAKRALPALYKALEDESPHVRIAATSAIWEIVGQPAAIVPVLFELLHSKENAVRTLAAHALGNIGSGAKRGLPDLHRVLESSAGLFRVNVAEAILRIDAEDQVAFATLLALLDDPIVDIRCQATYALSAAAGPRTVEVSEALQLLANDTDPLVQAAAKLTANHLTEADGAKRRKQQQAHTQKLAQLVEQLDSDDAELRKHAAAQLAWMGADAKPVLTDIERSLNDESAVVRATAAWAVWEVGRRSSTAIKTLVPLLKSDDEHLPTLAAFVLGSMHQYGQLALPALRDRLEHCDGMLKLHIAEAIAKIDPQNRPAVDVLTLALADANPDVRSQAAFALSSVGVHQVGRVIPVLARQLSEGEPAVAAASRLTLVGYLESKKPGVTALTAYVLGSMGKEATPLLPDLHARLESSRGMNRLHIGEAIIKIDSADEPAIRALLSALNDEDTDIRSQAAFALGAIDARQATRVLPLLVANLSNGNEQSQSASRLTLESFLNSSEQDLSAITVYMLGRKGTDAAPLLSKLHGKLAKSFGQERLQVAEAIVRIDPIDKETVGILIGALTSADAGIRCQAAHALSSVGPLHVERARKPLLLAIDDAQEKVREAAHSTLGVLNADAGTPVDGDDPTRLAATVRQSDQPQRVSPQRAIDSMPTNSTSGRATLPPTAPKLPILLEPEDKPIANATPEVVWADNDSPVEAPVPGSPSESPTVDATDLLTPAVVLPLAGTSESATVPTDAAPFQANESHKPQLLPFDLDPPLAQTKETTVGVLQPRAVVDEGLSIQSDSPTADVNVFTLKDKSLVAFARANPVDADGKRQPMPEDDPVAEEAFRAIREAAGYGDAAINQPMGTSRGWAPQSYYWEASALAHRPVYFEETNLERYGNGVVLAQPIVSAAHFVGTAALLPYLMVVEPPQKSTYTLGHYRPGSDIPFRHHRLPVRLDASLVEAATIWGLVLIAH